MKKATKDYSREVKNKAIQRAQQAGVKIASAEYEVPPQTLYGWLGDAGVPPLKLKGYADSFKHEAVERARIIGVKPATREVGVAANTLAEWGQKANPPLAKKQPHSEEFIKDTLSMIRNRKTWREVATTQRISFKTLSKWIQEYNDQADVPLPKNKKGYPEAFKQNTIELARQIGPKAAAAKQKFPVETVYDWGRDATPPLVVNNHTPKSSNVLPFECYLRA